MYVSNTQTKIETWNRWESCGRFALFNGCLFHNLRLTLRLSWNFDMLGLGMLTSCDQSNSSEMEVHLMQKAFNV